MRSWGQGERAIFQEIMAKSFPEVKAHSQEAQQITPGFKKKKKRLIWQQNLMAKFYKI